MGGAVGTLSSVMLDRALLSACREGDIERTRKIMLEENVNINCYDGDGWTPLMLACKYGHVAVADLLISASADITRTNFLGLTAMHYAVFKESPSLVAMLNRADASIITAKENELLKQLNDGKSTTNPVAMDAIDVAFIRQ